MKLLSREFMDLGSLNDCSYNKDLIQFFKESPDDIFYLCTGALRDCFKNILLVDVSRTVFHELADKLYDIMVRVFNDEPDELEYSFTLGVLESSNANMCSKFLTSDKDVFLVNGGKIYGLL